MRILESLTGKGTVISRDGTRTPVEYELQVLQDEVPAGHLDDPHASIPGLKSVHGRVLPALSLGEMATLELKDGRRAKFFWRDSRGSVTVSGPIER